MTIVLADLANPTHHAAILDLLDMYSRNEFGDGKPLSAEARANLITGLIKHGKSRVFLAYEGDEPAGLAICFIGFSSFKAKPLVNVHDLAVAPQFRGQGIGKALLEAVAADARALGCGKVTLEVRRITPRRSSSIGASAFRAPSRRKHGSCQCRCSRSPTATQGVNHGRHRIHGREIRE